MRRFFSVSLLLLGCATSPAPEDPLRVGVATVDITPVVEPFEDLDKDGIRDKDEPFTDLNGNGKWDPVWMAGFGTGRAALSVHDRLWARAVYFEKGPARVWLIALDLVGVSNLRIRGWRAKLGGEAIIASTHVHSGPDTLGLWGPLPGVSGLNDDYIEFLEKQVLDAARGAQAAARPAWLHAGSAKVEGVVKDTRAPDVRVDVVRWITASDFVGGQTIATLVFFASHPESMGSKNRAITSDYPHFLRERVEKRGGTCAFFSADLGGMQTPDVKARTFEETQRVGEAIADAVGKETPVGFPELRVARAEIEFPLDNKTFIAGLKRGTFGKVEGAVRVEGERHFYRSEIVAVRLGDITILTCPGEALPEVGKELFAAMTTPHRFLIGLGNDEIGYILPKEDFDPKKYEESMSLGPETAPILVEAARKLLRRLEN